jgi:hypothetical protein
MQKFPRVEKNISANMGSQSCFFPVFFLMFLVVFVFSISPASSLVCSLMSLNLARLWVQNERKNLCDWWNENLMNARNRVE